MFIEKNIVLILNCQAFCLNHEIVITKKKIKILNV